MKEYNTLYQEGIEEIIIEKSKFIGCGKEVNTEQEANDFIEKIRKKHYNATHNVWAYVVGDTMSIQRYSDDGEPGGTAGIPVLETLKKESITNAVLVVTRYFGGIKLGAGGLVRAYSKTASSTIRNCSITTKTIFIPLLLTLQYPLWGKLQNDLSIRDIPHKAPQFTEMVQVEIFVPENLLEEYKDYYKDLTMGNISFKEKERIYLDFVKDKIIFTN